ncbi:MAG: leucine-rich repeat domain-containing protein [Bacteroidales bacterium]|nr:leucine-rich repeat domain-containing protein [Bacteroidales bacterium]
MIHYTSEVFDVKIADNQVLKCRIVDSQAVIVSGQDVKGELIIPQKISKSLFTFPVVSIEPGAFENNKQLTKVVLPEGLQYIKYNAFASCTNLRDTVTLPVSLLGIGNYAFGGSAVGCVVVKSAYCHSLDTINYHDDFAGCFALKTVIVDKTVDTLCPFLFESSSDALENVYFPDTLDKIAKSFLAYSHKLKNVRFPKTLNTVGSSAFFASGIERVVLPNSVRQIESYAFRLCWQLRYLDIGENIENISELALADMNVLDTLIIRNKKPPVCADNTFFVTDTHSFRVFVPAESVDLYKKNKHFSAMNIQPLQKETKKN